jgi:nitrate/TMAO reductase-like tetraheme cytochrome c subunit
MSKLRVEARHLRTFGIAAVCAMLLSLASWTVTDRLEQRNDFCTSCHLEADVPLHIDIRRDFDAAPPRSLASLHGGSAVEGRVDSAFRCIDCHGGKSWKGRARVKALAAKDAFWYAVGRFEEPDHMAWPLWEEDCRKCHAGFDTQRSEPWENQRFHELPLHNVDLGVACVECHRSHDSGGDPKAHFLRADWVRTQCTRCHMEFEEVSK